MQLIMFSRHFKAPCVSCVKNDKPNPRLLQSADNANLTMETTVGTSVVLERTMM